MKVGARVVLASGGPVMKVIGREGDLVSCAWRVPDGTALGASLAVGNMRYSRFLAATLRRA